MRASSTTWFLLISSPIVAAGCGSTHSTTGSAATTSASPLTSDQSPDNGNTVDFHLPQPTISTSCTPIPGATDCFCDGGAPISGGAFSGSASNRLNASQVGPSFGGSSQEWRVSCVDQSSGNRTQCSQPFAVCLQVLSSTYRIETSQCTKSQLVSDCTCASDEIAVSGGAYSGEVSSSLNASQAGPSFGASPQTWRSSCVDGRGARVACEQPFAVCVNTKVDAGGRDFKISTQCIQQGDLSYDCDCGDGVFAVSGGAYAGLSGMLNASEAGPQVNFGSQWWHVSCVDREGAPQACLQPFAVCGPI